MSDLFSILQKAFDGAVKAAVDARVDRHCLDLTAQRMIGKRLDELDQRTDAVKAAVDARAKELINGLDLTAVKMIGKRLDELDQRIDAINEALNRESSRIDATALDSEMTDTIRRVERLEAAREVEINQLAVVIAQTKEFGQAVTDALNSDCFVTQWNDCFMQAQFGGENFNRAVEAVIGDFDFDDIVGNSIENNDGKVHEIIDQHDFSDSDIADEIGVDSLVREEIAEALRNVHFEVSVDTKAL